MAPDRVHKGVLVLEVWKLRSSIGRSVCSFLCRVCFVPLFRQNYRRLVVCVEIRVLKHTAIPRTSLLAWRWKPVRNRFGLRVRELRSQTELLARDVGPLQHVHLHNTTQTQNVHAFSGARSYDPILQEVKDLHLRICDRHTR